MRRLLALAGAPPRRVALAAGLGALTVIFGVGLMATAGFLIARAAERPAILSLTVAIVGVRFFGLARPVVRYCERLTSHDVALRVLPRVRAAVYARIEPLAPAKLDGYRRGDLLARLVADVDALQDLHLRGLLPPLAALVAGAASVGVTVAFLPAAAVVLGAGLLAGGIAVPLVATVLDRGASRRQAGARGALTAELVEILRSAPEIAVNGAAAAALGRVRRADGRLVSLARRDAATGGLSEALALVVSGATVAAVLAVAVGASAAGRLDRVTVALLGLLALAAFEAVAPLPASARELGAALASGRRVLDLLDTESPVTDPPAPAPPPQPPFTIALEGVRARYRPGEPPALDGLDLRLEPGRRIALLGPSGSGKTTVVNLLLRFLDPEDGRVTLAGRDLREYRQDDVRRVLAVAGQESHLFSASIRDNVALARPAASDGEIEHALRLARIWDWVRALPDGWNTLVGEEGRRVSGGQRQRLVVARALLAETPVLILDEPTAHLDPLTARRLMDDVLAAAGERSVLVITHRPEGLELVDEIVRLAPA